PTNGPTYGAFLELDGDDRPANVDRGKTYSFDYGSAHFVAIDTELFCDGTTECADYDETNAGILVDWLEADLAAADAVWTIVFLHRGPYSLSYDTTTVRDLLVPVFEAYGVDLVLSGHDHQYSRSVYYSGDPIVFNRSDAYPLGTVSLLGTGDGLDFNEYSSSIGTTYLVGNSAGTKFYSDSSQSGIFVHYEFRLDEPVIPIVTVTPQAIVVVSYYLAKTSPVDIVPIGIGVLERFRITH
ncbi:MAG: metallophosphoesterase, partial [Bacillota bacterium]|nr:metallophosphoesterase [Bacillota bacterium]